ncbi:Gfo/Idh/MocA family protein [Streptomyces sp. NPDC002537]
MKIGLLGAGFAVAHAGVYAARPDTEVVDSVYGDPEIDLVDVCLPTALHKEHILRALAADKHVLCELPAAPTVAEAEEIVRAAEASGKRVFIDMFMRVHPAVRHLHRVIRDGSLGELRTLRSYRKAGPVWGPVDLGLDRLALEVMLSDLDYTVAALGRPRTIHAAGVEAGDGRDAADNYAAAIGHVLDCLTDGAEDTLLTPRAATEALRLALDIDQALARS